MDEVKEGDGPAWTAVYAKPWEASLTSLHSQERNASDPQILDFLANALREALANRTVLFFSARGSAEDEGLLPVGTVAKLDLDIRSGPTTRPHSVVGVMAFPSLSINAVTCDDFTGCP